MEQFKEKLKKIYIFGRYPERDWRRIITLFFILFIVLSAGATWFAVDVKSKTESLSSILLQARPQVGRTRGDDLKDLVATYNKKAETFLKLQSSSGFSSVDPSR